MKEHCLFKEALKLYPKSTQQHNVCTVGHCMSKDCYVGHCPDESCLLYSSLALCFSFPFLCKFVVFSMIFSHFCGGWSLKVAPYSFLTARELVSKSRDGASFKKSTRNINHHE